MNESDSKRIQDFLKKWLGSEGNERANYQTFFGDFCGALGVDGPSPKGSVAGDPYCFDKDIKFYSDKAETIRFADFYKESHFLIEAKQGSKDSSKGHGKRGTKTYLDAMQKAFNQARSYAYNRMLPNLPPFLMTCDIGDHFEVWEGFSGEYGSYGARKRINLNDLAQPEVFDRFVAIFTDPQSLNPEKYRARVTREVASELAKLSRWLEEQGHDAHETANFLMRCIFTMFAEDVELLKGKVFTVALRERWIPKPSTFKPEIEALWQTMNTGGTFGFEQILRFNGSFFEDATAFELPKAQLEVLYASAAKDWSQVEPAIFGTLLERALEKKERSRLGAHYTPRSYVERLVRPVVMEPLRQQWDEVELELKRILETTDGKNPSSVKLKQAEQLIRNFLGKLRQVKILDPACGTGNFLYVTLDLLKTLEAEVYQRLEDVTGESKGQIAFALQQVQVDVRQFLGIEINPRAAAIAELVIWIGYLQWQFKQREGKNTGFIEPILQNFHNIECRDAVLAYDGKEPDIDTKTNEVRTRWGGRMMRHPVTGKEVPDPSDRVVIYRYLNARAAEWPEADYVVSNPPFIGKINMREALGDGYAETLRRINKKIPDSADLVMYWWNQAADLTRQGKIKRFGFISTNSISQTYNRRVIESYLVEKKNSLGLFFAIPDHPWVDSQEGASIRIAMTALGNNIQTGILAEITSESERNTEEKSLLFRFSSGNLTPSLTIGTDLASLKALIANDGIACVGYQLTGQGFVVNQESAKNLDAEFGSKNGLIWPLLSGRDITQRHRDLYAIDLFGFDIKKIQEEHPFIFQWLIDRVKPEREQNNNPVLLKNWWVFEKSRNTFRPTIKAIDRFIVTSLTSKHRFFVFEISRTIADSTTVIFALDDGFHFGVLSSRIHTFWSTEAGSRLGVGNDPRYIKTVCFDPFPFPDPIPEQKQKIRELGDRLDTHRKQVQAAHPEITITGMYNLLEKLRAGQPFTDGDREYNNKALVSTLKQIHDELDAAVLEAYGWQDLLTAQQTGKPAEEINETILERLVALNAERAAEERNGLIRWLRPEYQAPDKTQSTQTVLEGVGEAEVIAPIEQQKWPTQPKAQLAAIRDLLRTSSGEWTVLQIASHFTGRNTQKKLDAVRENCDRLEWFGLLMRREEAGVSYWQYAELQQTA